MSEKKLEPPTEVEVAELLHVLNMAAGGHAALVLRRLASERDALREKLAAAEADQSWREVCELKSDVIALRARVAALEEGLRSMRNNAAGLSAFEHEIRAVIGHTNWSVLQHWIQNSDSLLAAAKEPRDG